ncbi:MAG: transporter substrate-binding domain-containing protein [Mesorhizobium sp.]|nr:transporter substrate-binding domain-containing protein [Mesorhizobium sp.]MBL8579081.1 transporter substrate-binding domain-containing protein [Mesorhizobium sp.]
MTSILKLAVVMGSLTLASMGAPAQADELEAIKEKGVLRIAMSGAYPPFNFVDQENKVVGFDPAIGEEIAKRIGVNVEVVTTAWDGIIGGLLANKFDAIVGSMSITDERKEVVDFVGPYYTTARAIFVKEGSTVTFDQLKDLTIGATLGETHEQWAREQGWNIRTYKGLPELMLELENGRVDAIVTDNIPVMLAIKTDGRKFAEIEIPGNKGVSDLVGIAIRKNNPDLHKAMQEALDAMQADGTYLAIAEKWVGGDIR